MLAEFLVQLEEVIKRAQSAGFLEHESCPSQVFLQQPGGAIEAIHREPCARDGAHLETIADVLKLLLEDEIAVDPEVWIDGERITVILDGADRHDRVHCPLILTGRFKAVLDLDRKAVPMTSAEVLRLLRFELHGPHNEKLIPAFRRVNFQRRSEGGATIEHGKEALGRSIEAQVQQVELIPETFSVHVPVFATPGAQDFAPPIRIGIHIDHQQESFTLRPLADETRQASFVAIGEIRNTIADALDGEREVPIFCGTP